MQGRRVVPLNGKAGTDDEKPGTATYQLPDIADAMRFQESGEAKGKIAISV